MPEKVIGAREDDSNVIVGNHASVRSFHVTRAIFGDKSFEKTFNTLRKIPDSFNQLTSLVQVKQTTQSSYNAIIRVYADKEKFEDALNIYERLKGYNIQNYSTYHSMIEALQKNKDVKGTVKVLTDLVDDDILWRNASNSFGEKTNLVNLLHKTMKW